MMWDNLSFWRCNLPETAEEGRSIGCVALSYCPRLSENLISRIATGAQEHSTDSTIGPSSIATHCNACMPEYGYSDLQKGPVRSD